MANTKVTGDLIAASTITATNLADGAVTAAKLTGITTTSISEGDKLFYTDARVGTYLTTNGYDTAASIIATITDSAPVTLDTLNELAAALGDDPNYATTTANLIGTKLPLAGGTLTGALSFQDTSIPSAGTARIFSRDTNSYLYLQTGSGNQIQLLDGSQNTMAFFNPSLISFSISNSEAMRIDSSGNVDIGSATSNSDKLLRVYSPTTGYNAELWLGRNSTRKAKIVAEQQSANSEHDLVFYTNGTGADAVEKMRIDYLGKVGIGLSSSTAKLEVLENLYVKHPNAEELTFRVDNYGTTGTDAGSLLRLYDQSGNKTVVIDSRSGSLRHTYFNNGGNFGIGETSPDSKLHIDSSSNSTYTTGFRNGELRVANDNSSGVSNQTSNIVLSATGWEGQSTGVAQLSVLQEGGNLSNGTFTIKVRDNGTHYEAFRIKHSGNVGIGTPSPSEKLHVESNSSSGVKTRIHNTGSSVGCTSELILDTTGNNFSIINYPDADTSNSNKTKFVTTAGGGHFTFETGGSERMRISNNGITFNGDTAAANALDDYEEGTWTPGFHFDIGNPTISYVNQQGYYQKIGNTVTVWFDLYGTGMNSGGYYYARLGGLPFAPASNNQYIKAPLHHSGNSTFSIGLRGGTNPVFYYNLNRTGFAVGTHVDSAYITGHFSYIIA